MKILLDENLPHKLRTALDEQGEVYTTHYMGWSGLDDAALLQAMEKASFELLITADSNLSYQQNVTQYGFKILVLLLKSTRWQEIAPRINEIHTKIEALSALTAQVHVLDLR